MTSFADMPARIAAVLTGQSVGEPHPRDHDPEGCAACLVLDGAKQTETLASLRSGSKGQGAGGAADHRGSRPSTWRVGRKVGRTIYLQFGAESSDDDPLIGVMDSPELAAEAVESKSRVAELERERAGLLARAEQAEAEHDEAQGNLSLSDRLRTETVTDLLVAEDRVAELERERAGLLARAEQAEKERDEWKERAILTHAEDSARVVSLEKALTEAKRLAREVELRRDKWAPMVSTSQREGMGSLPFPFATSLGRLLEALAGPGEPEEPCECPRSQREACAKTFSGCPRGVSAIFMICSRCQCRFIAGMVGMTPWPPHVCPDGTRDAPARHATAEEWNAPSDTPTVTGRPS